jgi:hypothetical protein
MYAIGEIVLVVVGILIALQINKLNNDSLSKILIRGYAEGVAQDLNKDIAFMDEAIEAYEGFIAIKEWGLRKTSYKASQEDSLISYVTTNYREYQITNQTFEKIKNSGISEFYKYKDLFDTINNYYTVHYGRYNNWIEWDARWSAKEFEYWFRPNAQYEFRAGNEYPLIKSEDKNINNLIKAITTPEGRNRMVFSHYRKTILLSEFKQMKSVASELVNRINSEIK